MAKTKNSFANLSESRGILFLVFSAFLHLEDHVKVAEEDFLLDMGDIRGRPPIATRRSEDLLSDPWHASYLPKKELLGKSPLKSRTPQRLPLFRDAYI